MTAKKIPLVPIYISVVATVNRNYLKNVKLYIYIYIYISKSEVRAIHEGTDNGLQDCLLPITP